LGSDENPDADGCSDADRSLDVDGRFVVARNFDDGENSWTAEVFEASVCFERTGHSETAKGMSGIADHDESTEHSEPTEHSGLIERSELAEQSGSSEQAGIAEYDGVTEYSELIECSEQAEHSELTGHSDTTGQTGSVESCSEGAEGLDLCGHSGKESGIA
jgi:hypothetical protein